MRQTAGALSLGLVAAVVAALAAHVAIDAVGDVALVRDAYDGLAHDSRGVAALGLLLVMLALASRLVLAALGGAAGRDRFARLLRTPASPAAFVATVVLTAVALLVGMESLDSLAATGGLNSLADALGGSPALGLGVVVPLAWTLGWIAWRALRWLAASHEALLRAICAVFAVSVMPARPRVQCLVPVGPLAARSTAVLRRAAKRGPPARLFV